MIFNIKDKKIKKIKIGNFFPEKNEIYFPENWGTKEVEEYIEDENDIGENKICDFNQDKIFSLKEIK